MREILFRGKKKDNGEWVEGWLTEDTVISSEPYKALVIIEKTEKPFEANWDEIIPETVSEFTGLTDKNGTKIFEGDILIAEWDDAWGKEYFAVARYGEFNCSCCEGVYGFTFDKGDIRLHEHYKVVGNLWDNPELMKRPIFANKTRYNITNTSNSSKFDDMVDDLKKGKQPKLGASMEGLTKRE